MQSIPQILSWQDEVAHRRRHLPQRPEMGSADHPPESQQSES
ncbi:hypothetical protein [Pseudomonas sp. BMS12]|nr:hypothetical protein [Pseudomonas sp. BMS12]